jgi:hypothetical protein
MNIRLCRTPRGRIYGIGILMCTELRKLDDDTDRQDDDAPSRTHQSASDRRKPAICQRVRLCVETNMANTTTSAAPTT